MTTLAHTPYDGSTEPFTVGLAPLDLNDWIEVDEHLEIHLNQKERLFNHDEAAVFRAEDGTEAAQAEVLALLLDHLGCHFPETYAIDGDHIRIVPSLESYRISEHRDAPLKLAAHLVQEDLVLMRKDPQDEGYRLVAAALCFPSSWSLAEKFGHTMPAIHAEVPSFNDGRIGRIVAKLFDNLSVDRPVWRLNWSLYGDDELHHPHPGSLDARVATGNRALFVRVERQTLRRLPVSGDILFTIRVQVDPIAALAKHPDGTRLAAGLRQQLLALNSDQLAYKGLAKQRDAIAEKLRQLAGGLT